MPLFYDNDAIHQSTAGEINNLTEKVSPATGDMFVGEDSAASYAKIKMQIGNLPGVALPTNFVDGLGILRNASFLTSKVDIAAGVCRSDDDTTDLRSTSVITVNLAAAGANGLDTGAEAANTWYYLWLIYNPTTVTYAGLFSLSTTAPTMPSGYTKKRRIGSVRNNASSNFFLWKQIIGVGRVREYRYDEDSYDNLLALNAGSATTFTDVACSTWIPPTTTEGLFFVVFASISATNYVYLRPNGSTQATPPYIQYGGTTGFSIGAASSTMYIRTDASGIIEYKNVTTLGATSIIVVGYREII
jgi:hypothetical protein